MSTTAFLTQLLIPVNMGIALGVLGMLCFVLRRKRTAWLFIGTGATWVLLWSIPVTSLWAGGRLEALYPYQPATSLPTADAIVVLGGHTGNNRQNWFLPYDPATASSRVNTAGRLYRAQRANYIVLSGAALDGQLSEAEMMARALQQQGVPQHALLMETSSLTTYENGHYTKELLDRQGFQHVLLVTSALHMPRAMAIFNKEGVTVTSAASPPQITIPDDDTFALWRPNVRTLSASRSIIKEYAGLLVYWLRGWI